MRIAHLSDLHLLDLGGAVPWRLFNKRLTGYMNLRFRRNHVHKPAPVTAAGQAIRELGVDHVVITGDLTNLALEREFELVQHFVEDGLGLSPDRVSIVPGNHDVYTRGSHRAQRFRRYFRSYVESDIEGVAGDSGFPFVRLRGDVALIGLCTAVARPPLVASGTLGPSQLARLRAVLRHPEVRRRFPVLLQHHPPVNPPSLKKTLLNGLSDAAVERWLLRSLDRGLVLHGHLHHRIHRALPTKLGKVDVVGATSASLVSGAEHEIGGFNLYDVDAERGVARVSAQRFSAGAFEPVGVPMGMPV